MLSRGKELKRRREITPSDIISKRVLCMGTFRTFLPSLPPSLPPLPPKINPSGCEESLNGVAVAETLPTFKPSLLPSPPSLLPPLSLRSKGDKTIQDFFFQFNGRRKGCVKRSSSSRHNVHLIYLIISPFNYFNL